jgi:hypothetical protein
MQCDSHDISIGWWYGSAVQIESSKFILTA